MKEMQIDKSTRRTRNKYERGCEVFELEEDVAPDNAL